MRTHRARTVAAAALVLVTAGCSLAGIDPSAENHEDLRFLVPNAPGGGYDTTARLAAQVLEQAEITDRIEVFNLEGASGAVGLARMARETGNPDLLLMMGLGVVGAVVTNDPVATFADVTPVARLINEPEIIVVPEDSPYDDLDALVSDWRRRPGSLTVGGGSAPGGPDHLAPHLLARTLGIEASDVDYERYDGGGPLLAALLTGDVDVAVSGVGEYTDQIGEGPVRVLAVTSAERVPGLDAPTLREQGVDFVFANWRGVVAPPGLSVAEETELQQMLRALHESPAWRRTARQHGWTDAYLDDEAFEDFLVAENRRVAGLLDELRIR